MPVFVTAAYCCSLTQQSTLHDDVSRRVIMYCFPRAGFPSPQGEDSGGVARAFPTIRSSSQPPSFSRRVLRPSFHAVCACGKSPRARGTPRGPTDPRKFRKKPASPPSLQRPARGVLRLSSARPPVAEVSIHRFGPGQRLAVWHGVTALPPKSPVTPSVAPGRCSFSRRALGVRVAPVRGHRSPVPLNDASRSALGWTGLGAV